MAADPEVSQEVTTMKTMTCRQLAGACDEEFHAETFEKMGELSRTHAMAMAAQSDQAHIAKM